MPQYLHQYHHVISPSAKASVTCQTTATRPTTTPSPSPCNEKQFYCNESSSCLPGLLVCDGVTDCANGADERGCPAKKCEPGFVYCGDKYMQDDPCMPVDNLCNSWIFCHTYDADESLCGLCPPNYCLHGGNCSDGYEGYTVREVPRPSDPYSPLTGGQIAGIVIGTLLAVGPRCRHGICPLQGDNGKTVVTLAMTLPRCHRLHHHHCYASRFHRPVRVHQQLNSYQPEQMTTGRHYHQMAYRQQSGRVDSFSV
ncbi:MAM and LDL-receptor class A domain-containing protein 1 [Chionoecetes opilio]|uniref:MAM and LDL-receptor class A domain-containing protein 1 n=1 Tax=Chionoecetes opilio TaxID=41210 RepID=A0A8J5D093_CHIOP|nr:MAM and LDL-receptor class A domain-containing protein 1 [Chionoecetes opilio]